MKFSFNRAFALIVISSASLLAATSCSKSSSNGGGSSAAVTATIGSSAWVSNYPIPGIYSLSSHKFLIAGVQIKGGDSTGFEVSFVSPISLNQAISSDGLFTDVGYLVASTQLDYEGNPLFGNGNGHSAVTITSYDSTGHKIAGTFNGVLYNTGNPNDSVVIANGKFNTTFQVQ